MFTYGKTFSDAVSNKYENIINTKIKVYFEVFKDNDNQRFKAMFVVLNVH